MYEQVCPILDAIAHYGPQQIQGGYDALVSHFVLDNDAAAGGSDQAAFAQNFKMARDHGLGKVQFLGQFGHIVGPASQGVEQNEASGISQG